jgi:hypothetical protein
MDLWMKSVWVLAALVGIACLVALNDSVGAGGGPAAGPVAMEYFTVHDRDLQRVDYYRREGRHLILYNSVRDPYSANR